MDDNYIMIEEYLEGGLSGDDLAAFEKKLQSDDQLKEDLLLVKKLRSRIRLNAKINKNEVALKQSLHTLGKQYFTAEITNKPFRLLFRMAAAVGLLLICFFGVQLTSQQFYSNQALANRFYVSLEDGNRGKVSEAEINKFKSLEPSDSLYLFYQYQLGDVYMNIQDFEQAIGAFSTVLNEQNNPAYDKVNINFEAVLWNRLQAKLALDHTDEVLVELESLIQSDISKSFKDRAKKLIRKLNSPWHKLAN